MLTVKSKINITAHPKFYRGAKRAYIGSERIARSSRPVIAIVSRASMSFIQDHPESEAGEFDMVSDYEIEQMFLRNGWKRA